MDEKKVTNRNLVPVLSIAGSDSSGGAGIQADLKTMLSNDCYGMSAITALTAQNTMGVTGIMDVTPEFLRKQIDAVFLDIPPKAVKIGMVSDKALINTIAEALEDWHAENCGSGDGCDKRELVVKGRCDFLSDRDASSTCDTDHPEYPGGRAAYRNDDSVQNGYGTGGKMPV